MKRLQFVFFCLVCLIIAGCATPKALFLASDFSERQPHIIAVLPIEDARLSKEGDPKLEEKLIDGLRMRKYKVLKMQQIKESLQKAGVANEEVHNRKPEKLCNILNVDAILICRLDDYESSYQLLTRTNRLEMTLSLINGKDSQSLWQERVAKHQSHFGMIPAIIDTDIVCWVNSAFKSLPVAKNK